MLTSLHLTDIKSFADAEIPFAPLTVLVGLNGAGKSNVLDAIQFLTGISLGFEVGDVLDGLEKSGVRVLPGVRGGIAEFVRSHRTPASTIEYQWRSPHDDFRHRVEIRTDGDWPGVVFETLVDARRGTWSNPNPRETTGKWRIAFSLAFARPEHPPAPEFLRIEAQPGSMREWVSAARTGLGSSGENLSAVLARRFADPARKAAVEDWVSELLGGEAKSLEILRAPTGDVMLALVDATGARVTARSISDGTLKFLAQIVAAEELASGRTLFMEEPDQGLHPSRVHLLVQKLEAETAASTGKQVVVTTHSPQFLNWLSRDRWPGVVLIARDPETGTSIARRVVDLPGFDALPEGTLLGDLLANGWLERAL